MKKHLRSYLTLLGLLTYLFPLSGQVGGRHVFEFLDLSTSARVTALGEHLLTVQDPDVALATQNPAVLTDTIHGQLSFNHRFYFEGIDHGFFGYGYALPAQKMSLFGGIQYIRYGDFTGADSYGNITGSFQANELALVVGASKNLMPRLAVGMNVRFIQSRFESYNAHGIALDLGALYALKGGQTHLALVVKHAGLQLDGYGPRREPLPFDLRMAVSQRLKYLPFRFSITAHHLHRWNILYDDPDAENTTIFIGEDQTDSPVSIFADNFFRHLVFNGEFLIGKQENFSLRLGYNHLRRRELGVTNFVSLTGFSFGAGIKFGHFSLDYGYAIYHLTGGTSHVGLSMNVNKLFSRF